MQAVLMPTLSTARELTRRTVLRRTATWLAGGLLGSRLGDALVAAAAPAAATPGARGAQRVSSLLAIEQRSGGRLGVAVIDTASGERFGHREEERFPLCSTFKLLAVAAVLARVDQGAERLDRRIAYTSAALLEYAPVTRARLAEGSLPVADLCEAALGLSDNTAANLLLASLGGPGAVTAYARTLGDQVTRLDRNEPLLNEAVAGDPRDTTTPSAMAGDLHALLLGETLSKRSRELLAGWLVASKTGNERLRAGVPPGWRVGDKTGSGNAGTTNDVAIVWPPGKKPILVAAYLTGTSASAELRNQTLAAVARLVTQPSSAASDRPRPT